jgi:MYXO-CTERM domain-containing protein
MRHALFGLVLMSAPAFALTQPNGAAIPSPMGCAGGTPTGLAAVFACQCTTAGVCNIGAACPGGTPSCDNGQHGTCETTIWHNQNDNSCIPSNLSGLNPATDGNITPDTFHPTCGLTFTVASRGTAMFQNAFGWYNVTGSAPAASDLHVMLDCTAKPGAQVVLDVRNDPAYKGGDIGFFLLTPEDHTHKASCAAGNCCPSVQRFGNGEGYVYYSQRQFNPDNAGAGSFIHLVVFDSKIQQHKFYFAWEDIYGGSDDDFTDLVTSVDGVECSGGGTACSTGMKGVCGDGVNRCDNGVLSCHGVYTPQPERCDGLDEDCDGVVDNGATCPNAGDLCVNGTCVPHCASAEFACAQNQTCDQASGLCVDPACAGVSCSGDKICRGGSCVGACDGVTCPHGQICRLDSCLDPCAGASCPMGQVCAGGLCVAGCNQCGGVTCAAPLACDMSSGACTDPSCPSGCPAGTWCDSGTCKDVCNGAVCPNQQLCVAGKCVNPGAPGTPGGPPLGSDGGANGGGGNPITTPGQSGCACGAQASPGSAKMSWLFSLLLVAGFLRRRRG